MIERLSLHIFTASERLLHGLHDMRLREREGIGGRRSSGVGGNPSLARVWPGGGGVIPRVGWVRPPELLYLVLDT